MSKADEMFDKRVKKQKYQIVFYPTGFWFKKLNKKETSLAYIYKWGLGLGLVEIRRWCR